MDKWRASSELTLLKEEHCFTIYCFSLFTVSATLSKPFIDLWNLTNKNSNICPKRVDLQERINIGFSYILSIFRFKILGENKLFSLETMRCCWPLGMSIACNDIIPHYYRVNWKKSLTQLKRFPKCDANNVMELQMYSFLSQINLGGYLRFNRPRGQKATQKCTSCVVLVWLSRHSGFGTWFVASLWKVACGCRYAHFRGGALSGISGPN